MAFITTDMRICAVPNLDRPFGMTLADFPLLNESPHTSLCAIPPSVTISRNPRLLIGIFD